MELLSRSYVDAIAAYIGAQITEPYIDNDSVDGTFHSSAGNRPRIDFQLKSTYAHQFSGQTLSYPLPVKNYNDLIQDRLTPIILILLVMPDAEDQWLDHGEEELLIRNCAYWTSLAGKPVTDNVSTVSVNFDKASALSPEELQRLLSEVSNGNVL